MLGWRKHKLESRLLGEILITSDMQMTPSLWLTVVEISVSVEIPKVSSTEASSSGVWEMLSL